LQIPNIFAGRYSSYDILHRFSRHRRAFGAPLIRGVVGEKILVTGSRRKAAIMMTDVDTRRFLDTCAGNLNLDADRIAAGEDDAGGAVAAVVTMVAKPSGGPKIGFQLLFRPAKDCSFDNASCHATGTGPWLTRDATRRSWSAHLPDLEADKKATVSPLRASLEQLRRWPNMLIVTAEYDILLDEGEAYATRRTEAGVVATSVRYLSTLHDFAALNEFADSSATRAALTQAVAVLRDFIDCL
jgi:acetyl esterase